MDLPKVTTIQKTAKKFKFQQVASVFAIIVSVAWLIASPSMFFGLLVLFCIAWYTVNRVRIWWHHK